MLRDAITLASSAAALPVLFGWAYLAFLSFAALVARPSSKPLSSWRPRLTVLVPAHNEAGLIARCVRSLVEQSYPAELFRVVVIADNCRDSTAAEAAGAGATVMVRNDETNPGKGRALRWAIDSVLSEPDAPDGIVIVDADSVADPGLLEGLAAALASGAQATQSDYTVLQADGATSGDRLRALAILLFNRARNLGRAAACLPASLLGNGMLLSRELLEKHPWSAFSAVEDLEFSIRCRINGVVPRFLGSRGVRGPIPVGYRAAVGQRLRWEGGRFYVLRRLGPLLLERMARHPDLAKLDALLDLLIPPLWIFVSLTAAGLLISVALTLTGLTAAIAPELWGLCVILAFVHVFVGLKAAGASTQNYAAFAGLPSFLAWKIAVYLRLLRGFNPNLWQRSVRNETAE